MKAVIYARYSSDNQREESIEGQIRECTAFAGKNGITILRHYIDRAFSVKTDNRPEFQNMIKDSGKRLFDMIIYGYFPAGRVFECKYRLADLKASPVAEKSGSDLDCLTAPAQKFRHRSVSGSAENCTMAGISSLSAAICSAVFVAERRRGRGLGAASLLSGIHKLH